MKKNVILFCLIFINISSNAQFVFDSIGVKISGNIVSAYSSEYVTTGSDYSRTEFTYVGDTLVFNYFWKFPNSVPQAQNLRYNIIVDIIDTTKTYCAYRFKSIVDTNTTLVNYKKFTSYITIIDSIIPTNLCAPLQLNNFNTNTNLSYNTATKNLTTTSKSDIQLYNLNGQLIFKKRNSQGPCPLPADLASGIYVAVCNSKNGVERLKIYVE